MNAREPRLARRTIAAHDAPSNRTVSDAPIQSVSIEAGCISCKLCQDIAPEVFRVDDDADCVVLADAARHFTTRREDIEQAARDCPVEVIRLERAAAPAPRS